MDRVLTKKTPRSFTDHGAQSKKKITLYKYKAYLVLMKCPPKWLQTWLLCCQFSVWKMAFSQSSTGGVASITNSWPMAVDWK